jgi:translation elongation factor EF-1beta
MALEPGGFGLAAIEIGQHDADNAGYADHKARKIENVDNLKIGLARLSQRSVWRGSGA